MRVMIYAAAICLTSSGALAQDGQRQATIECLQRAQAAYAQAWARECAARSLGSNNCGLPRLAASELRLDRSTDRNDCYAQNAAGLFAIDKLTIMPGAGAADATPAPAEEPRRKFWISPQ